jgi:recombination protein RecT
LSDTERPAGQSLAAPAPTKHSLVPLKECKTLDQAFASAEFMERIQASAPRHVSPNRMLRTFVSAVSKTPLLAQVSLRSFLGACLTCSQVGLEPNTPLGHIWLLPFKTRVYNPKTKKRDLEVVEVNTIFGYPGLLDLSFRTTKVKSIHADVVWPGDEFSYEYGSEAHLRHKPRAHKPNDTPAYAYMHASLEGGQAFEVLPWDEVLAIRDKSQAYRFALSMKQKAEEERWASLPAAWTQAPWVAHVIPMGRKTAFRAGSKWLPRSIELAAAIQMDEAQERNQRMDFSTVLDAPTIDGTPDYLGAAADAANLSDAEREGLAGDGGHTGFTDRREPANNDEVADATRKAETAGRRAGEDAKKRAEAAEAAEAEAARQRAAQAAREAEAQRDRERIEADLAAAKRKAAETEPDTGFEAVLVNSQGEPGEQIFINPASWAVAFTQLWHTEGEDQDALREHNADALADAMEFEQAKRILFATLDRPVEEPPIETIQPPVIAGKTSAPGYVKLIREALPALSAGRFVQWVDAQREVLEHCPPAQRMLAIKAISGRAGELGLNMPDWIGDLIKAKPATPPAAPPDAPPGSEVATLPAKSADERWVDARLAEMPQITTRAALEELLGSSAVQTMMSRLRRDKPTLFDICDRAFFAKFEQFDREEREAGGV